MDTHWETARVYTQLHEAQLDRSLLEGAGIPTFIPNEYQYGMRWVPFLDGHPLELQVPADDLESAKEILGPEPTAPLTPTCPHCGSGHTVWSWESQSGVWLFFLLIGSYSTPVLRHPTLHAVLLGLLITYFLFWKNKMRCRDCGNSFNRRY